MKDGRLHASLMLLSPGWNWGCYLLLTGSHSYRNINWFFRFQGFNAHRKEVTKKKKEVTIKRYVTFVQFALFVQFDAIYQGQ